MHPGLQVALKEIAQCAFRSRINLDGFVERHDLHFRGSFALVYQGTLRPRGTCIAVKSVLSGIPAKKDTIEEAVQQLHTLTQVRHKNVLPPLGITTEFYSHISIISAWMENGNAHDYVQEQSIDPRPLIEGIAQGLLYLHSHELGPIIHGNMKGSNVLISSEGDALVADFGLSPIFDSSLVVSLGVSHGCTPNWMAPENLESGEITAEGDIWAFAMTVLELFTRKVPFHDRPSLAAVVFAIAKGQPNRPSMEDTHLRFTDNWWDLCCSCWNRDLSLRPSMADIVTEILGILTSENSANIIVQDRMTPQPDPRTGLYDLGQEDRHEMKEFVLPLVTAKEAAWEAKHTPMLQIRAKFQPYDALRQRFWAQYLREYDTDDTYTLSRIELTSMLDSLGSTLSAQTIDSFYLRHGKRPAEDELTIPEAIQCLETELCRPKSERKRVNTEDSFADSSTSPTTGDEHGQGRAFLLDELDFSGPSLAMAVKSPDESLSPADRQGQGEVQATYMETYTTESGERPLVHVAEPLLTSTLTSSSSATPAHDRQVSYASSEPEDVTSSMVSTVVEDHFERVINVKNCPLCYRPRLNSMAEMDIVTHLAICASKDWERVDRIVMGNFVTASQAQRKWYTRIMTKVSNGNYKLGANSANIIVQNRMTGQLEEEKMQVYVRLGIRLLYKGARSRMEGARARRLLKSLTIKQGMKYDSPESVRDIQPFIDFHKLDVDEILDPIESFKTFNDFFYRKLKPTARPTESPDDPCRLVSAADCRLMVFESVTEATRLWIKGREFTVARLLGDAYRDEAERYNHGALAIFRLAPQDYHRFHVPVDGTIGKMTDIAGEYYTVNPQAIRTALDVYGENARKILPIDSPRFGRVMAVCVGAMMVGSIRTVVCEGQKVSRGDELGYFAFGGSTIVILFEKGVVEWDEDLLINGRASLETLVRVGMGIGRCSGRRHAMDEPNAPRSFDGVDTI